MQNLKRIIILSEVFLYMLVSNGISGDMVVATFNIEPDTFYNLEFEASASPGSEVRWLVRMFNDSGDLPYDGCLENKWQSIGSGYRSYSHAFLSSSSGRRLEFLLRYDSITPPEIKNIKLQKIIPPAGVLNGDFSLGPSNYSGWNELYNASLVEKDGKTSLVVNQNGYALTDYFPVVGGGGYSFVSGAKTGHGTTVLAYDGNKHLIGEVPYLATHRVPSGEPQMRMPAGAVYARILFTTWWDHVMPINIISHTGLVPVGNVPAVVPRTLPERGKMEIILHPGCDPREERAAKELQYWMSEITGRTAPLLAFPSSLANIKIYIGRFWAESFTDDLQFLKGSDGYAVRRRGDNIYVFGAEPRGALFGVYALLEKNSDIIWPRPNPKFSAIFSINPDMSLKQTDFRSRPVFQFRHISRSQYDNSHIFQDWCVRNGVNNSFFLGKGFAYLLWCHGSQVSFDKSHLSWVGSIKEKDERYLPLIDGQRDSSPWRQPCYTYPKTAEAIVQSIRASLATLPGKKVDYIASNISDNWSVCACETCMQPILLDDGTLLEPKSPYSIRDPVFFSTRNFQMLNVVADALAREFPDLHILSHAYIFTAEPPKVKVHPAIIPQFAAYPTQNLRFPVLAGEANAEDKEVWKRRFLEWVRLKPDGMGWFGYYYTAGFNAVTDTAVADWRALAESGGVQAHTEGLAVLDEEKLSTWDVDGIEKWVMARLMWNPRQDPATLREEYISKVYREASSEMRQFYKLVSDSWHGADKNFFVNCHSSAKDLYEILIVKPGLEAHARELLKRAESAAVDPRSKEMIQRTLAHFNLYGELGRQVVPYVDESRDEWSNVNSTHWEKAVIFKDFKKVDDWRTFNKAPASHQTEVRIMHDGEYLYFRVTSYDDNPSGMIMPPKSGDERFPNGDRIEIVLRVGSHEYYFAVGPNGNFYAYPKISKPWHTISEIKTDRWIAMVSIPLSKLLSDSEQPSSIGLMLGRVYRLMGEEREESSLTGSSIYNREKSLWVNLNLEVKGGQ